MRAMAIKNEERMTDEHEETPIDEIIARVDSYIKKPELATSETLTELKEDLIDLKSVINADDNMTEEEKPPKKGGLAVMIAVGKKKHDKEEEY